MKGQSGFSLVELIVALGITLGVAVILFQIFRQNERVFRDQDAAVEVLQSARAVAAQIADEIRIAGQGVPVYASTFDDSPTEHVAVFLAGTDHSRIHFRAGLGAESVVTPAGPLSLTIGTAHTISVEDDASFSGSTSEFVFLWGPASGNTWTWTRAELLPAPGIANTLRVAPRQMGDAGRSLDSLQFAAGPVVTLDEAVAIYLDSGGSIRRAAASDLSDPANPVWSPASEIGRGFSALTFAYYNAAGGAVTPHSLTQRVSIARVDIRLTLESGYAFSLRTIPRHLRIR